MAAFLAHVRFPLSQASTTWVRLRATRAIWRLHTTPCRERTPTMQPASTGQLNQRCRSRKTKGASNRTSGTIGFLLDTRAFQVANKAAFQRFDRSDQDAEPSRSPERIAVSTQTVVRDGSDRSRQSLKTSLWSTNRLEMRLIAMGSVPGRASSRCI